MFSTTDTIAAIATPPGRGGIGVVRLSGPRSRAIAGDLITRDRELAPRHATLTRLRPGPGVPGVPGVIDAIDDGGAIDQVVATYFPAPHSYTGEDVVELSAHGSPIVLRATVAAAVARGARLAEPGEFTLRAFLNGRIDLMQAEAVADLIDAVTPLQARTAFDQLDGTLTRAIAALDATLFDLIARLEASVDFPEEGFHFVEPDALIQAIDQLSAQAAALLADARRGRLVREGLQVAIVGRTNVGKSSLFNALAGADRAIVTEIDGTTRDLVTEVVDIDGFRVTLVDTAGLRDTADIVEAQGVARAKQAQTIADLILLVVDRSRPLLAEDHEVISQTSDYTRLIVSNKADLPAAWTGEGIPVSATTGEGLDALRRRIIAALDVIPGERGRDRPGISNVRHIALVQRAHDAMIRARAAAGADSAARSEEFVLADLQEARAALEEVAGRRAPGDLLEHIFARFCVGK